MSEWPVTRVTLLERLRDPRDQQAWAEFVALYGPMLFQFARRRLPQDHDAADLVQEVLTIVMRGRYQRPRGRFQKWLVTVVLNKVRDHHAAQARRPWLAGADLDLPSTDEEEWDQERQRHLLHAAAERVRARTSPTHWQVFERMALENRPGQEVAGALALSLTNVYAIKCRLLADIKDEVQRLSAE